MDFSKKIDQKEKKLLMKYMSSHLKENNNPNIEYFFKTSKYTMCIYYNNTLLIQGNDFDSILSMLHVKYEKKKEENININIGTDESGNGDLFGGISVAAVRIPSENINKINELGVKDSKKLSDEFMKKIYPNILNLTDNCVRNIEPFEYNQLQNKYNNANTIKTIGHNYVIKKLYKENQVVMIDKYTSLENYKKQISSIGEKIDYKVYLEEKAESKYLEVACASIIARVNFLSQIEKIEDKLKMKIPLGCVTYIVKPVLNKIKNDKNNDLNYYIKEHFKTNKD